MTEDDHSIDASLEFSARRAKGLAQSLLQSLTVSDVPPYHWDEVIEHLRDLVREELVARGLNPD
ncbi:MAG: hypothetical protein EKK41_14590 [Hyphomicrobiales bacterium]|nr:MAG: hypothetical protein EKK41_14590 [Hyphomicrobiales bacterium]